jgi:hypothetical protein
MPRGLSGQNRIPKSEFPNRNRQQAKAPAESGPLLHLLSATGRKLREVSRFLKES